MQDLDGSRYDQISDVRRVVQHGDRTQQAETDLFGQALVDLVGLSVIDILRGSRCLSEELSALTSLRSFAMARR